jgi:hypothetical protein
MLVQKGTQLPPFNGGFSPMLTVTSLRVILSASVLSLLVVTAGCRKQDDGDDDDDNEQASATTTSALQAQSQDGVTEAVVDVEGGAAPDPEDVAKKVVDLPTRGLCPEGCATKVRDGNVVTLTLNKCTGPFGRVEMSGTLKATFSKTNANNLHVEVATGVGTTANGKVVSYNAEADVRFEGSTRVLTYHGKSNGETKRGVKFARETNLAITADVSTHCASIDGTSKGTLGRYDVNLMIEGFKGCRDACPTAGLAKATVDGPFIRNASVEVRFDGSDEAQVKIDRGTNRRKTNHEVKMDCEAAEAAEAAE